MEQKLELYRLVSELYGWNDKNISIYESSYNGSQSIDVQVFKIEEDNVETEIHSGNFLSFKDAIGYYKNEIEIQKRKLENMEAIMQTENGMLIKGSDGVYNMIGYENTQRAEESIRNQYDEFDEYKLRIDGYETAQGFTNENGKVYLKTTLWIPVTQKPDNYSRPYKSVSQNFQFHGIKGLRNAIKYVKSTCRSINSRVKTNAGTNFDIFELFLGNRKLNRLNG